ncbi:hypothetical protein HD554DRAFT_229261 [Boletus coccyginus]|nr:hypothetical protein HD554DRAFT_229261 [Boletus coccyginus]
MRLRSLTLDGRRGRTEPSNARATPSGCAGSESMIDEANVFFWEFPTWPAMVFVVVECLLLLSVQHGWRFCSLSKIVGLVETLVPAGHALYIVVDEAHTSRICGHNGTGCVSHLGFSDRIHTKVCTFGKGWGFHGGMCCSFRKLIFCLVSLHSDGDDNDNQSGSENNNQDNPSQIVLPRLFPIPLRVIPSTHSSHHHPPLSILIP